MALQALDTQTLLGVKIQLPKFTALFLQMFFPDVAEFHTEEIAFDKVKKNVKLAPFVAPMVSGKPNRKQGGTLTSFAPAYVKPTDNIRPGDMLKRRPGEPMGGSLTPVERRMAHIAQTLEDQEKSITYREELMAVQAVTTGLVTVSGEGYPTQVVDYGRSAANNITLAGAAKWDTVDPLTYDPTDDIEDWAEKGSGTIGAMIFDKYAWRKFAAMKAVEEKLDTTSRGSTSSLELGPQVSKEVMYKGNFGELEIYVYVGKYTDDNGVDQYYMPANTLVLAPLSGENVRAYGAIQDAKANANGVVAATRYPSNWYTDNPSVEWLQTQSAPLPVLVDADSFVAITLF
ncbi:MAG: major capsid protein [Motiliproteus sp.]